MNIFPIIILAGGENLKMLALDEVKIIVSKYEDDLPSSMETFRRWIRKDLVSGSVETNYYGGTKGKDVFYNNIIVYEIITAIRLKKLGCSLEEIANSRKILKELSLFNDYSDSDDVSERLFKDKKVNEDFKKMLKEHEVIPIIKNRIEDKRKEIEQKINNNADISEIQQEFKKLEKLEQTALSSRKYLKKYIEVREERINFKLPSTSL